MPLVIARVIEPEAFREVLRGGLEPGPLFRAHFPGGDLAAALTRTEDAGLLDAESACALCDVLGRAGHPFGVLDIEPEAGSRERFLAVAAIVLGDRGLAERLALGGWLGRQGPPPFGFGSLPLRVVRRQLSGQTVARGRALVEVGWDSELINVLESAALRAEAEPEGHLVLVGSLPEKVAPVRAPASPTEALLTAAVSRDADDVLVCADAEVVVVAAGQRAVLPGRWARGEVETLQRELGATPGQVALWSHLHPVLGPIRVSTGPGVVSIRRWHASPRLAAGLEPVVRLREGLVVVGGAAGSGRTTLLRALLDAWRAGRVVASLEEPPRGPGPGLQWAMGSGGAAAFLQVVRTAPVEVVGVDLVDDREGLAMASALAEEGRLVVCTVRAPSLTRLRARAPHAAAYVAVSRGPPVEVMVDLGDG